MSEEPAQKPKKDGWDKAKVVLEPVGGLLTAISVAALGFYGSRVLETRQTLDSNFRLYSELMSKREESESALRKDMFQSIIQSFLKPGTEAQSLEAQVLNLELLAYNFHESLNLKPLFIHLEKEVGRSKDEAEKQSYFTRMESVAREVTRKQMLVLEGAGKKFDRTIDLDSVKRTPGGIQLEDESLSVDGITRAFRVFVLESDLKTKNIKVRLEVRTVNDSVDTEPNNAEFWIGFFDFPMIDNVRLSNDQRCAVVLTSYDAESAEVSVLDFPGSHASLKEKPYFEEILHNLREHAEK